jgi:hypothetical protein
MYITERSWIFRNYSLVHTITFKGRRADIADIQQRAFIEGLVGLAAPSDRNDDKEFLHCYDFTDTLGYSHGLELAIIPVTICI